MVEQKVLSYYVVAVRDVKSGVYGRPMCYGFKGEAIREFSDVCNDTKTMIGLHPEDFQLFHIGSYDPMTGVMEGRDPEFLHNAVEFVKK